MKEGKNVIIRRFKERRYITKGIENRELKDATESGCLRKEIREGGK